MKILNYLNVSELINEIKKWGEEFGAARTWSKKGFCGKTQK